MRPECIPLMYASRFDAAWYLGKEVCRHYQCAGADTRKHSEDLIMALIRYIGDNEQFAALLEIFECAKRHAGADDPRPVEQLKVVEF